jgi:hypothetical protein
MVLATRRVLVPRSPTAAWPGLVGGTALLAVGASMLLPLKLAIPHEIPFWIDQPLASAERGLFGTDAWIPLDRMFGWAAVPIDRIYAFWLPVHLAAFFAVLVVPPSPVKSRALITFSLAWLLLGGIAATLLSSAGPIFFDRLLGGDRFALLSQTLQSRGARLALAESNAMWRSYLEGHSGMISGISAAPSLHVAMSVWIYLAARTMAPRAALLALSYAIFIWVASVQLGWHYASDGLIGAIGMVVIWIGAGKWMANAE